MISLHVIGLGQYCLQVRQWHIIAMCGTEIQYEVSSIRPSTTSITGPAAAAFEEFTGIKSGSTYKSQSF